MGESATGRRIPNRPTTGFPQIARRSFLAKLGIGAGAAAVAGAAGTEAWFHLLRSTKPARRSAAPPTTTTSTTVPALSSTVMANGMRLPTAAWVAAENARPGTLDWVVAGPNVPGDIEGYASQVSAVEGDAVTLYVNTVASTFHVEAYRMGWYAGTGGRLVWVSQEVPGVRQVPFAFLPATNTVECHWAPSLTFPVTAAWPPGVYLLKLVGSNGQSQFVPLTVRDDSSTAAFAVMNSVTTWQAYNLWGEYSLYYGRAGTGQNYANRSLVVSFDRPYPITWANGAADLMGNELPLILLMEKNGLDVTYMTDVDLHANPAKLLDHSALLSLGHDEYWSMPMRQGAAFALDAGVNLVFFGANACYRRIRLEASPVGNNRRQVCYKTSYTEDPLYGIDDTQVTADWPNAPAADPESSLIGNMYQSNPVKADMVISEPTSWLYSGIGFQAGDSLPSVVGTEYDRYDPTSPAPPGGVEILAHSPLVCNGFHDHSDMTWYTTPGGVGVFATGTNWWISKLVDTSSIPTVVLPPGPIPDVTASLAAMTLNVLSAVGNGPAGLSYPSTANWQAYYPTGLQSTIPSGDKAA